MAGKKSKGKTDNLLEQEDVLQALVIADSFNVQFAPITRELPRALIPLVNTPLIDYTIGCLATAGIQEIFVFCCSHADQIKAYLESSKWNTKRSPVSVTPILSEGCHSIGDALREIERHSFLRAHFVLVTGDLVCNMQLKPLIEIHKARYKKDKSSVMTLVYKQACPGHRTRHPDDEFLIVSDAAEQRLLSYQKTKDKTKARFPLELFQEHTEMDIRFDLMDCHVGICSPRVMEQFVDNFDYQTKDDFIRGVLVNEEIEGNKLYVHIISEEYAARASNLPLYDAVSKDVIRRWAYPVVPDNLSDCYSYKRHNIYMAKDITLESGSRCEEDVVIGQGTTIGNNTIISNSVIGENCKIGENVVLENAYVWGNVTIDSNCKVQWSILCDRVHLSSGVTVEPGCILSFGVKIGCNISLPEGTLLTSRPLSSREDEEEEEKEVNRGYDIDTVGEDGQGFIWIPPVPEEDDDDEEVCQQFLGLTVTSVSPAISEVSSSEESEDEDVVDDRREEGGATPPPHDITLFYNEVLETLQRATEENVNVENLVLEINSSKFAYNISMKELNYHVFKGILELPHLKVKPEVLTGHQLLLELKKLLSKLCILLRNYYKSAESQIDCLTSLEEYCLACSTTLSIVPKLAHILYELEVLSEEVVIHWHKNPPATDDAEVERQQQLIRKQMNAFVTWLEEAEEESDSEED